MTIPEALASAVDAHGDHPAVVEGDTRLSYADLDRASRDVAAALVAVGVGKGDRVAIWAPNRPRWIVVLFGLARAGATLVPVNTRFKGREAADVLARSGARVVFTVTDFLGVDHVGMLRDFGVPLPTLDTIVVIDGPVASETTGWDEFVAAATAGDRDEADRRAAAVTADDPSDILFTSGTTGVPKGVVQTHGRTMTVARDWVAMTGLRAGDRYLMVNPYFHMFGLKAGILASVSAGATMYPEPVFDVDRALAVIEHEHITVFPGAPTLYQSLLDRPAAAGHDLSSLRVAATGAADIPVALTRRIIDELPFEVVVAGYGLTEGGTASATDPGDDPEVVATTVGRARPGFELKIVDARGDAVPTGETGEVVLRGASVMSHYLDDPDATAAVLSDDGWLRTGDLGTLDADGRLRIVGRAKDMFIVGGFNAYPAEIENTLLRPPAILRAAVIGVPDDRLGEVGMAFVVLADGAETTPDEIVSSSREQMANYKAPRHVEILDELPLNSTGKVEKLVLADRAAEVLQP